MCGVRALPAALPDVPGHGRGGRVAARPHRGDARGRTGDDAEPDAAFVQLHGRLRAVPRLRDRVPVGRAVRPADGGHAATRSPPRASSRLGGSARVWSLGHHRLLLAGDSSARCGPARPPRAEARHRALRPARRCRWSPSPLEPTGNDVWLFTGCVMDAWQRAVHAAAHPTSSAATGVGVALPGKGGDCCGALHVHAGLTRRRAPARRARHAVDARRRADPRRLRRLRRRDEGLRPPARHRRGTSRSRRASSTSTSGWRPALDALPGTAAPSSLGRGPGPVPPAPRAARPPARCARCSRHMSHVVELDDEGLCCGAGGAYSALHPEMASAIRERKMDVDRASRMPTSWRAPTPAARCTLPPPASRPPSRWRSWTRRSNGG